MDHDAAEAPPEATAADSAASMRRPRRRPRAASGLARNKPAYLGSSLFFQSHMPAPLGASEGRMRSASLSRDQPGSTSGTSGSGLTSSTACDDGLRQLLDAAELVAQADGGMEETPEPEVHSAGLAALVAQVSTTKSGSFGTPEVLAVIASIPPGAGPSASHQGWQPCTAASLRQMPTPAPAGTVSSFPAGVRPPDAWHSLQSFKSILDCCLPLQALPASVLCSASLPAPQ